MIVEHQLVNDDIFYPNWNLKYLFLGTFNPQGGRNVRYFYARQSNYTWDVLSEIFDVNFRYLLDNDFGKFKKELIIHGIACMDMISNVEFNELEINLEDITGNGYSDSKIINKRVARVYNTNSIQEIINNNPDVKIYTTWGKGKKLLNWVNEVNLIQNKIQLVSPSRAARVPAGENKFQFIVDNWRNNIEL